MAIADIYRLAVIGRTGTGALLVNTLHYVQQAGVGDNPGVNLVDAYIADAAPLYADILSDQCFIEAIQVRNVTDGISGTDYTLPVPLVGVLTGDMMPPQDSAILQFKTPFFGRRFRGRNYLFPTVEAMQNAGQWTGAYPADAIAYGNALLTIASAGYTYTLAVHSDNSGEPGVITSQVTQVGLNSYVRGHRSRQIGVGA